MNKLFESVIRESSDHWDADALHDEDSMPRLFEQVIREAAADQRIKIKKTSLYRKWFAGLKDEKLQDIINDRLLRIRKGLFGEIRPERGVSEFFIDYGPGYRLYFIKSRTTVVILLCGGDKSTQDYDVRLANKLAADLKKRYRR